MSEREQLEKFHKDLTTWTDILYELQRKGISIKNVRKRIDEIISSAPVENIEISETR